MTTFQLFFPQQDDVTDLSPVSELSILLRLIFHSLAQCSPTSETAEILIASVSKALLQFNRYQKKLNKKKSSDQVMPN